jgi:hypothetical protein
MGSVGYWYRQGLSKAALAKAALACIASKSVNYRSPA